MRVKVLGRVESHDDEGTLLNLGPFMAKALFALVAVGGLVPAVQLRAMLWPDAATKDRSRSLITLMSKLRHLLGERRILSGREGYQLVTDRFDHVDLVEFLRLRQAAARIGITDPKVTAGLYTAALELWQVEPGFDPLPDMADTPAMGVVRQRLLNLRVNTVDQWAELQLLLGHYEVVVDTLEGWVAEHPTREHLLGLLMRGLAGAGRKADAISWYRGYAEYALSEFGTTPGPLVEDLHTRIHDNDRGLNGKIFDDLPSDVAMLATGANPEEAEVHRMTAYILGGTKNFSIDRNYVERLRALDPRGFEASLQADACLGRVTRVMVQGGTRQILDTSIPMESRNAPHEVAALVNPSARTVYAVPDQGLASLYQDEFAGHPNVLVVYADVSDPLSVVQHPLISGFLDLAKPVFVHNREFVNYNRGAPRELATLMGALASGSSLTMSCASSEGISDLVLRYLETMNDGSVAETIVLRTRAEIEEIYTRAGLVLLDPGVRSVGEFWSDEPESQGGLPALTGVGVKP